MNKQKPSTRKRERRKPHLRLTAAVAIALAVVLALIIRAGSSRPEPEPEPKSHDRIQTSIEDVELVHLFQAETISSKRVEARTSEVTETAPELLIGLVDLSPADQKTIYQICDKDPKLFCTVMAIAKKESEFSLTAIGDGGKSCGMMQIYTTAQADRIAALGITDLMDMSQNVTVAVDYIKELAGLLAPGNSRNAYGTNDLFMAYNMGWRGYLTAMSNGKSYTEYSTICTEAYITFMEYMGEGDNR